MSRPIRISARPLGTLLLMLCLLPACSRLNDNLFVLLEDADGQVGSIEVSNDRGSQTIDQTGQAVALRSANSTPSDTFTVSQEDIDERFRDALAAEPEQPVNFILYFRTGSTELRSESAEQLPQVLQVIANRTAPIVAVVGHTDTAASARINAILALERAEAVAEILIGIGIPADRIEITSHGENNLLVPTEDNIAEPRNRRVEITVR